MNTIEVSGANLGRIEFIVEKTYVTTDENSPLKGKKYCNFKYQGKAFSIPSESSVIPFLKDRTQRAKIKTVFLLETSYKKINAQGVEETIPSLTYDGFLTVEESLEYKQSTFEEAVLDAKIANLVKGNLKAEVELTEDTLRELEGA